MKVIAINGSPRKNFNTGKLLNKALDGARSVGADTESVHLYDYSYKGCISCFACKLKNCKTPGKCCYKDELTPILEKVTQADALIMGCPIYFHMPSGQMKTFMERFLFPFLTYTPGSRTIFNRKMPIGMIYTMGAVPQVTEALGYASILRPAEEIIKMILGGPLEVLRVTDTYQFDDYSKYNAASFNVDHKTQVRDREFPAHLEKAFDLGRRFAETAYSRLRN
jgi:multimeric flavodoxin WrbA